MNQHTPGPWQVNGSTISGRDPLDDHRGNYNESPVCTISHGWRNPEIDSANARLIARAPEMYVKLARALVALSEYDHGLADSISLDVFETWQEIDRAAKALG